MNDGARSSRHRILFVGQIPPPVHGQAIANAMLIDGVYDDLEVFSYRFQFSTDVHDIGQFQVRKLWILVKAIFAIPVNRRRSGAATLVYSIGMNSSAGFLRDAILLPLCRPFFRHTIFHVHTGLLFEQIQRFGSAGRILGRLAYGRASMVIMVGKGADDKRPFNNAAAFRYLPYGVSAPDRLSAASKSRRASDPASILFVANLSPGKGAPTLIEAAGILARRGHSFEILIGGAEDRVGRQAELEDDIRGRGLEGCIRLLGPLNEKRKWAAFETADVFCLPTFYEGEAAPIVIVEAMAAGLPVVATQWRGNKSLVADGQSGFLVPPRDAGGLADRLAQLIADPDLCRSLGQEGARLYRQRHLPEVYCGQFEKIIKSVVGT